MSEQSFREFLKKENQDWTFHYFIVDLLYYYSDYGDSLMTAILQTGVDHKDPIKKFKTGSLIERIRISKLYYWLELENQIYLKAKSTNNLIELYFYQLAIDKLGFRIKRILKKMLIVSIEK